MLRIFVAARSLAQPFLALKGAVLAALVAAVVATVVGPFVASVLLTPSGDPSAPPTAVTVAGTVNSALDGTKTALVTGVSFDGVTDGTVPFDNILDQAFDPTLNELAGQTGNTAPFDNLAFASTSFDDSSASPEFDPFNSESTPPGPPSFSNDGLFFASGGGITGGGPVTPPEDLSSLGSSEFDFTVTIDQPGSGGPDAPGLTIGGKILVLFVPEPSVLLLMSAGLGGLALLISRVIS
jgi:hypothetical protein